MGPPEIFSFLGAPTGIGAPRVKGPYRKVAPNKGPCSMIQTKGPLQKGAPTDKEPIYRQGVSTDKKLIQTKDPYRRCVIPTDKGPLHTIWGPYEQLRAPTDN